MPHLEWGKSLEGVLAALVLYSLLASGAAAAGVCSDFDSDGDGAYW